MSLDRNLQLLYRLVHLVLDVIESRHKRRSLRTKRRRRYQEMTQAQVAYLEHLEDVRHNRQSEETEARKAKAAEDTVKARIGDTAVKGASLLFGSGLVRRISSNPTAKRATTAAGKAVTAAAAAHPAGAVATVAAGSAAVELGIAKAAADDLNRILTLYAVPENAQLSVERLKSFAKQYRTTSPSVARANLYSYLESHGYTRKGNKE